MNVTINNPTNGSNTILLASKQNAGKAIGIQLKENDARIELCLNNLRAESAKLYGSSKAIPLIKHVVTNEKYSSNHDESTDFKLNSNKIYPLLSKELESASDSDKVLIANASIMLLKQGNADSLTQQQVYDLANEAGEMQKIDAYFSLLNEHNQSNLNVVDQLLPAPLATSFRSSEPLPADGLELLELSVISSRAYQAEPNQIRQLLTQMSLIALDYYGNSHANSSPISALAFKQVSGNYLPLACSTSIAQGNAYAATQVLIDDKGLLSNNHKSQPAYKRDVNNMLRLLSHSSDAEMMFGKIASSGVLDKIMMKQVYDKLLSNNDSINNKSALAVFVENIELSDDSLDSTDLLDMYNMALSHKYNQPTKQLLDALASKADDLATVQESMHDDPESEPQVDDSIKKLRQLHSVYSNNHKTIKDDVTHSFSHYTNITLDTEDVYGKSSVLSLADYDSPAHLFQELSDKQVSNVILNNKKNDIISVDIKNALKDYLEQKDTRLNVYMTKPISDSLEKVADILRTDEHYLTSILGTRQPANRIVSHSNTLSQQDMTITLSSNENNMSFSVSNLSSSVDLSDKVSDFNKKYQLEDGDDISVAVSSKMLNNDFLQHVTTALNNSVKEHGQKSQDCSANIELDKLLCLPVTALSDKIETNTIFNPKTPQASKSEVRSRL